MAESKFFWSVKEAAAYIPVHEVTLYDWIRSARGLPPRKSARGAKSVSKLLGKPVPYRCFGSKKILIPIEAFKAWAADLANN